MTNFPKINQEISPALSETIPLIILAKGYIDPQPNKFSYSLDTGLCAVEVATNIQNMSDSLRENDLATFVLSSGSAIIWSIFLDNHIQTFNKPINWNKYSATNKIAGALALTGLSLVQKKINQNLKHKTTSFQVQ